MLQPAHIPVYELTRGQIVESIHYGSGAVVDATGRLVAWFGDPDCVTYLRSSAKPFQALPLVEAGGVERFGLTPQEVALICASHSGTDEHVSVAAAIQHKAGINELDLLCGVHSPADEPTAEAMRLRGKSPAPNRHNCSGKHSGMLALAHLEGWPGAYYIDPIHPIQQRILETFSEMCGIEMEDVELGIDGCSAPNFAVPLRNAALGFAHLADPSDLPEKRATACRIIVQAMLAHPDMVAGPGRFDTALMRAGRGRILTKGGAEGYQAVGLLPGALGPSSPALGIALKISDGDLRSRARPGVVLEVLNQLGALDEAQLTELDSFGPRVELHNYRTLLVGEARPAFRLQFEVPRPLPGAGGH